MLINCDNGASPLLIEMLTATFFTLMDLINILYFTDGRQYRSKCEYGYRRTKQVLWKCQFLCKKVLYYVPSITLVIQQKYLFQERLS